jgi:hypothetical protein
VWRYVDDEEGMNGDWLGVHGTEGYERVAVIDALALPPVHEWPFVID